MKNEDFDIDIKECCSCLQVEENSLFILLLVVLESEQKNEK
jgi:hypothetical protein